MMPAPTRTCRCAPTQRPALSTQHALRTPRWASLVGTCLFLLLLGLAYPAAAQEAPPQPVTADEVNAIARDMFCPVCENVPLDICPTAACAQWRSEIADLLAEGRSEQEIKDDFVARYGDRVLGTPQDPFLRALSLATPWLMAGLGLAAALMLFIRWGRNRQPLHTATPEGAAILTDDAYRARLEQDLRARR